MFRLAYLNKKNHFYDMSFFLVRGLFFENFIITVVNILLKLLYMHMFIYSPLFGQAD